MGQGPSLEGWSFSLRLEPLDDSMEGEAVEDSIELIGEVVFLSDSHVKVVSLLIDGVGNPLPKFTVDVGDVSNNVAAGVIFLVVVGDDNKCPCERCKNALSM